MNIVAISGRIANEIEIRQTATGDRSVCRFAVAVDRPMVKDKVDFIDCVAWNSTAEFLNRYFRKGDPIEITGHITTGAWEDKNGVKHKTVEINAERINFVKQKKVVEQSSAPAAVPIEKQKEPVQTDLSEFEEILSDGGVPF